MGGGTGVRSPFGTKFLHFHAFFLGKIGLSPLPFELTSPHLGNPRFAIENDKLSLIYLIFIVGSDEENPEEKKPMDDKYHKLKGDQDGSEEEGKDDSEDEAKDNKVKPDKEPENEIARVEGGHQADPVPSDKDALAFARHSSNQDLTQVHLPPPEIMNIDCADEVGSRSRFLQTDPLARPVTNV